MLVRREKSSRPLRAVEWAGMGVPRPAGPVLMGIAFLRSPTVFIPDSGSWVAQRKEGKY